MADAQDALRSMIDYIPRTYSLEKIGAYLLASHCVNFKIPEFIDAGQYGVSALLPAE
ncbi:hypothetical protein [Oceanobacillus sp. CFH 90083]|uniref:hypothetical protein n=1 Tax=Oceanobacillus sp. CFH 90083 TaxID=2592336 RepID=UPI0018840B4C|nr:hypothetical protein [Oceanobacillus sp. CFH 90083]